MDRKELENKIEELRKKIADANKRLPAHTVRPHQLQEIEDLEEELELLESKLDEMTD